MTAVEPDPSTLVGAGAIRALSQETGVAIEVVEAFGEAIPLEAAGYDVVVARQVLHHANDLGQFCREMARLVRPGGACRDASRPCDLRPRADAGRFSTAIRCIISMAAKTHSRWMPIARHCREPALSIEHELRIVRFRHQLCALHRGRHPRGGRCATSRCSFARSPAQPIALVPFSLLRRLASAVDRRPGRLVSFIARKPAGSAP